MCERAKTSERLIQTEFSSMNFHSNEPSRNGFLYRRHLLCVSSVSSAEQFKSFLSLYKTIGDYTIPQAQYRIWNSFYSVLKTYKNWSALFHRTLELLCTICLLFYITLDGCPLADFYPGDSILPSCGYLNQLRWLKVTNSKFTSTSLSCNVTMYQRSRLAFVFWKASRPQLFFETLCHL